MLSIFNISATMCALKFEDTDPPQAVLDTLDKEEVYVSEGETKMVEQQEKELKGEGRPSVCMFCPGFW